MTTPTSASAFVTRVLPAEPAVAYDAWLDPESLAHFICPAPATPGPIECDPRIGGRLRIDMLGPQQVTHIVGEYLELERPHRLRFTWDSDYGGGFHSIVTVTLEPLGVGRTLMTIEHAPLPAHVVADHENGWARIAAQLEQALVNRH
jgi:uncharacterized protein YndB with AHSA1/START domain